MHKFVLILNVSHQFVELDFAGDEVSDLGSDGLELDMIASAVKLALFNLPSSLAVLRTVLVLAIRDH